MECYCCGQSISLVGKAKLRVLRGYEPEQGGANSATYQSYVEEIVDHTSSTSVDSWD